MKEISSPNDDGLQPGETKEQTNSDASIMAYYGMQQQLKRNFSVWGIAGFAISLLAIWEGEFAVFLYGFQNGGPAGLVYGYIFCWIGMLATTASLAECASMMPLSGGQYHWVSILAPAKWAKFLSFITGWVILVVWQAGQASSAFIAASLIQGLAVLNYPDYVGTSWQWTLIFYAVLLIVVLVNTFLGKQLPNIEKGILILHVVGYFAILITLVVTAPHGSTSDVFATFLSRTGWKSNGLSFFVGIISSVFSFLGADAACHMSEEIQNSTTIVPWSMVGSVIVDGFMGFAILIALLFCLGNIDNALATPTGFPFIEIFWQATNSAAAATAMASLIVVLFIATAVGIMATTSRLLWSFARDLGVPASAFISKVDERTKLPMNSILVTTVVSILLGLINIGSTAAFNAIMSINCAGYLFSYMVPIVLLLHKRLRSDPIEDNIKWGPFRMNRTLGPVVNLLGLIYCTIAVFFSFFPSTPVITPVTMNWSCLVFGAAMVFSTALYAFWGRSHYKWPIVDVIRLEQ